MALWAPREISARRTVNAPIDKLCFGATDELAVVAKQIFELLL